MFEFNHKSEVTRNLTFSQYVIQQLVRKKFFSALGLTFFVFIAVFSAVFIYWGDIFSVELLIALAIGIPSLVFSVIYLHFGVYVLLIISYFILGLLRFTDLPLGMIIDGLVVILLAAVIWRLIQNRSWEIFTNASGKVVFLWIIFNILQVLNPETSSKVAWIYAIRGVSIILLFYFVAAYAINTPKKLYYFVEIILFLSLILGLYGIFQEFNGLLRIEEDWVRSNEERFALYFNWGKFRKFSYFSSPTIFGITAASVGVFSLVLSFGKVSFLRRIYLIATSLVLFFSMIFSGTRTAYAIIPVAFLFFAIVSMKRNILIITGILIAIGAGVILSPITSLGPIDASNLERIRSAFLFQEDPSFNVRLKNQAFIQPYIQSHPLGAGLGSCGEIGKKYSPNSQLANFPPDSGFVKIAVESGYVGLFLYCILLFVIIRAGLLTYFKTNDPKLKNYLIACLTLLYCIIIANYAQETITFCPINIIIYVIMAALVNIKQESKPIQNAR